MRCSLRHLVLNGRINKSELVADCVAVTIEFEICAGGGEKDQRCSYHHDAAQEKRERSAISISPRKRDHARVETERHLRRGFIFRLRSRTKQSIKIDIVHGVAPIFSSCVFIFCRARNARTLIAAVPCPVIW